MICLAEHAVASSGGYSKASVNAAEGVSKDERSRHGKARVFTPKSGAVKGRDKGNILTRS